MCKPEYKIQDADENTVLKIIGPCCTCSCAGDVEFQVYDNNDQPCGQIRKQWTGIVKELFTDADNFGVTFPMDLDAKIKATLLGAVFLIVRKSLQSSDVLVVYVSDVRCFVSLQDFMFFEKEQNKEEVNVGMM